MSKVSLARPVVHRPAVVRVNQGEVPQLIALVDVWHPGRGNLEQRLAETVLPTQLGEPFLATDELPNDVQFELPAERPFHHDRAPA